MAAIHGYLYYRHMLGEETRTATSTTENRITGAGEPWAIWCVIAAVAAVIGVLLFQKSAPAFFIPWSAPR